MIHDLNSLQSEALIAIESAHDATALRDIEVACLGRKGKLTEILRGLKDLSAAEKGIIGQQANQIKNELAEKIANKQQNLQQAGFERLAETEWCDPTAPGTPVQRGTLHPVTQFIREAKRICAGLGFTVASGPEAEDDWHCFTALNIPADHPARDAQDTLFLDDSDKLLRTQMSSVQVRWMESHKPPFRIIAPGRVFRKDDFDASHSPMFHQLEGLLIDRDINLAHMKSVMEEIVRQLIDPKSKFRFRTSYFPFVEPGLEMDMSCTVCGGKGCSVCQQTGWVEIVGCGLVHPQVLRNVKIDPTTWSGFAFGFGIDRMVMLRHKINDIRLLYENDLRFLQQF